MNKAEKNQAILTLHKLHSQYAAVVHGLCNGIARSNDFLTLSKPSFSLSPLASMSFSLFGSWDLVSTHSTGVSEDRLSVQSHVLLVSVFVYLF